VCSVGRESKFRKLAYRKAMRLSLCGKILCDNTMAWQPKQTQASLDHFAGRAAPHHAENDQKQPPAMLSGRGVTRQPLTGGSRCRNRGGSRRWSRRNRAENRSRSRGRRSSHRLGGRLYRGRWCSTAEADGRKLVDVLVQ